jgi:hypothetical protein
LQPQQLFPQTKLASWYCILFIGTRDARDSSKKLGESIDQNKNRMLCTEVKKVRKTLVIMALAFFIVGIVLVAFSIQESYTEEKTLDKWDNIWSSTLNPHLADAPDPSWTLEIQEGSFFELNVSASDAVRVRIGTPYYDNDTGLEVSFDAIFDQVGTRFTQKVAVGAKGYCTVEIKNEGTTPVSIWGNVLAKKIVTIYQTTYPYTPLATPVVLVGLTPLIYGVLTKPKKRRSQSKARKTRNTLN